MLGPLLNPAHAAYGLVGVYGTEISELMARSLMELGMKKALVVHSMGLDELTPMGPADVVEITSDGGASPTPLAADFGRYYRRLWYPCRRGVNAVHRCCTDASCHTGSGNQQWPRSILRGNHMDGTRIPGFVAWQCHCAACVF